MGVLQRLLCRPGRGSSQRGGAQASAEPVPASPSTCSCRSSQTLVSDSNTGDEESHLHCLNPDLRSATIENAHRNSNSERHSAIFRRGNGSAMSSGRRSGTQRQRGDSCTSGPIINDGGHNHGRNCDTETMNGGNEYERFSERTDETDRQHPPIFGQIVEELDRRNGDCDQYSNDCTRYHSEEGEDGEDDEVVNSRASLSSTWSPSLGPLRRDSLTELSQTNSRGTNRDAPCRSRWHAAALGAWNSEEAPCMNDQATWEALRPCFLVKLSKGKARLQLDSRIWQDFSSSQVQFWPLVQRSKLAEINLSGILLNDMAVEILSDLITDNLQNLRSCQIEGSELPGRGPAGALVEALGCQTSRIEVLSLKGSVVQECGNLVAYRGSISHDNFSGAIDFETWSTVMLKQVILAAGCWYYEIKFEHIANGEYTQIGWASQGFECRSYVDGVGDDEHSWAFDIVRRSIWHNGVETPWGERLDEGDTLCCVADLENNTISFGYNGSFLAPFGIAFDIPQGLVLRPAITAGKDMRLTLNTGFDKIEYSPPHNALPISEWVVGERRLGTQWLVGSLCRLAARRTLRVLDLSNNGLDASSLSRIANAAQALPIQELYLAGNHATRKSIMAIASLLAETNSLLVLDLSQNFIGFDHHPDEDEQSSLDSMASSHVLDGLQRYFCGALILNRTLRSLNLAGNGLSEDDTENIAHAVIEGNYLRTLSFAGNPVSQHITLKLLTQATSLKDLDLSRVGILQTDDSVRGENVDVYHEDSLKIISPNLRRLILRGNGLGNLIDSRLGLFRTILSATSLEDVDLGKNSIDHRFANDIAEFIISNRRLRNLKLDSNLLESDSMNQISEALTSSNLSVLDVSENPIGASSCGYLLDCAKNLTTFSARMCEIGLEPYEDQSKALSTLASAISRHRTLRDIDLSQNALRNPEVAAHALGRAIRECPSLKNAKLSAMGYGAEGVRELVWELLQGQKLDTLDLSENDATHKGMLDLISLVMDNERALKLLNLGGNSNSSVLITILEVLAAAPFSIRTELLRDILLTNPDRPQERLSTYMAENPSRRGLVWTQRGRDVAEKELTSLRDLLKRVRKIEARELWTVQGGLHFHNVDQDIELDPSFQIFEGELCFDDCRGDIVLPQNLYIDGFLNFMRCTGEVVLAPGLHIAQDFSLDEVPRLTELPPEMSLGGAFFAIDCEELADIPEDFQQAPDQIFVLQRCPSILFIPDILVSSPGRIFLLQTGVDGSEIERLQDIAHPGMAIRSTNFLSQYFFQPQFPTLQSAVKFWASRSRMPEGPADRFARDVEKAVSRYFRESVTQFLAKLRMSKEFTEETMREGLARRVVQVLRFIVEDSSVREALLVRMSDSIDACGDKPIWALNQMHAVIATARARGNKEALRRLGCGMMRLGIVHEHARRKVLELQRQRHEAWERSGESRSHPDTSGDVDEICVYLFFEIELRERLGLSVTAEHMLFPNFIHISAAEINAAAEEAENISEEDFERWLTTWPEWQRQMRLELAQSMTWESLPAARIPKRVSLSQTTFLGDPMTEPVLLGKAGPWQFDELLDRWIETGMDFNNVTWRVDEFSEELGRVEPAFRSATRSSISSLDSDFDLEARNRGLSYASSETKHSSLENSKSRRFSLRKLAQRASLPVSRRSQARHEQFLAENTEDNDLM